MKRIMLQHKIQAAKGEPIRLHHGFKFVYENFIADNILVQFTEMWMGGYNRIMVLPNQKLHFRYLLNEQRETFLEYKTMN